MKGKGKAKEALNQTVIYVTEVKGILRKTQHKKSNMGHLACIAAKSCER